MAESFVESSRHKFLPRQLRAKIIPRRTTAEGTMKHIEYPLHLSSHARRRFLLQILKRVFAIQLILVSVYFNLYKPYIIFIWEQRRYWRNSAAVLFNQDLGVQQYLDLANDCFIYFAGRILTLTTRIKDNKEDIGLIKRLRRWNVKFKSRRQYIIWEESSLTGGIGDNCFAFAGILYSERGRPHQKSVCDSSFATERSEKAASRCFFFPYHRKNGDFW